MNNYYVYFLLDPSNFYLPFYVGKGKGERWKVHLNETVEDTINKRKYLKIQKLRRLRFEPKVYFYACDLTESEAYKIEEEQIRRFGRKGFEEDGILTNLCLGARPPGFNNCQDKDAFRKAISNAQKGDKNHFYGKTHSEESRKKIGKAHKGKTISVEQREFISNAMKERPHTWGDKIGNSLRGKKKTEEHKKKIGQFHKGKILSEAQKQLISEKMKGRKFSPETIEKMKKAAKLREEQKRKKNED